MAANTVRPSDTPRRANVPREVPAPPAANGPAVPEVYDAQNPAEIAAAQAIEIAKAAANQASEAKAAAKAEARRQREAAQSERPRKSWSIFSLLDRLTSMDGLFREGLPVRYLPKLLFVMLITLLYIGNTHYGNRMNRSIQRLKQETEDLRADYTTLKSDYMEASKQSEVARKVAALGMVESGSPPFRINVPAGHLDAAALELLPVLTADSLGARVARDSIAAQLADSLAGRRRRAAAEADGGPEIIAPPQPDELDLDATVVSAAPGGVMGKKPHSAAKIQRNGGSSEVKQRDGKHTKHPQNATQSHKSKPDTKKSVQKSTTQHKAAGDKTPVAHPAAHRSTAKPARR